MPGAERDEGCPMFRKLFQRFQPTTVEDPVFGQMTNDKSGFWAGKTMFVPLGREIDIIFRLAVTTPPGQEHREFFKCIVDHWPGICQNLRDTLFEDIECFADGTTMEQVFDSLQFEAFEFLDLGAWPQCWKIAATTPLDDHVFGIVMKGFEHDGFRMDG